MNAIMLGPPGAGKGTQAEMFARNWKLKHISSGELLRQAVKEKSELGQKAQGYMEKGELVPDSLMVALIRDVIPRDHGVLLDGFPRTVCQAEELDGMFSQVGITLDHVINLTVKNEEVVERLSLRGREDDDPQTIRNRLEVYEAQTAPLIRYYETQGKLRSVDGMGSIEAIAGRIETGIRAHA